VPLASVSNLPSCARLPDGDVGGVHLFGQKPFGEEGVGDLLLFAQIAGRGRAYLIGTAAIGLLDGRGVEAPHRRQQFRRFK
jgi:hypothetical protein